MLPIRLGWLYTEPSISVWQAGWQTRDESSIRSRQRRFPKMVYKFLTDFEAMLWLSDRK